VFPRTLYLPPHSCLQCISKPCEICAICGDTFTTELQTSSVCEFPSATKGSVVSPSHLT
jgi:hypothetical protein